MFQNTKIYQKSLDLSREVLNAMKGNDVLMRKIKKEALEIPVNILQALNQPKDENFSVLQKAIFNIYALLPLLELSKITTKKNLTEKLISFNSELENFPNKRKKILILTLHTGEGHRAAAFGALQGIQELYGHDYDTEVIDFIETMNMLVGRTSEKVYTKSVKYLPSFYKFIYRTFDKKWRIKLLNYLNYPLLYTKLNRLLQEKNPDLIISTHPLWDFSVRQIWKKYRKEAKFVSIVTDSITVHHAWITADTDFYIVPNEDTADSLRRLKVSDEKIKVFGFPLNPVWSQKVDRNAVLRDIGFKPDLLTILYIAGTCATRRFVSILKKISTEIDNTQIIVVTGRNNRLFEAFSRARITCPCKIFGWVSNMHELMKSCDIVITKAGGASVMECIAAKKPMIITKVISGQEEGNAILVKKHHLGYIAQTPLKIIEAVFLISEERVEIERNLEKLRYPNAAQDSARFVVGLVGGK